MAKKNETTKSTKKKAPVKKKPAKKAVKKAAPKKAAAKKVMIVSTNTDLSKVKKDSHLIKMDDVMTKNTHRFKKKKINQEISLAAFGIKIVK